MSGMQVRIVASAVDIAPTAWLELAPRNDPLWTRGCLMALENAALGPRQWDYIVITINNCTAAILPTFTYAPLDLAMVVNARVKKGLGQLRRILPRFGFVQVLFCGHLLGEGRALIADWAPPSVPRALSDAVLTLSKDRRATWVIVKDLPSAELERWWPVLRGRGFFQVPGVADAVLPISWPTWPEYELTLRGNARRNLGKRRRRLTRHDGVRIETVSDYQAMAPLMIPLYEQVVARAPAVLDVWSEHSFREFARRLHQATDIDSELVACWRGDELVGFVVLLVAGRGCVALRLGLDYRVAAELELYHNLHYQAIKIATDRKCASISFGQAAHATKRQYGCRELPLTHVVTHRNPILRLILRVGLARLLHRSPQIPLM